MLMFLFKSSCNNSAAIKTASSYSKKITDIQKRTAVQLQRNLQKNITDSEKQIRHSIKQKEIEELQQELEEELK